jgi:hypothetical protein
VTWRLTWDDAVHGLWVKETPPRDCIGDTPSVLETRR